MSDNQSKPDSSSARCPSCFSSRMESFYTVGNIPTNSCLLFESRQEAIDWPRRDLVLGFCEDCGFVANINYDPTIQKYSRGYEESQGASPRFNAFLTSLIESWLGKYDLCGKDIVEVGCGKGDFLIQFCRTGGCNGIGIDPTYDPVRQEADLPENVRFIQDFYSPKYADLPCDAITCRHTLEHIGPTGKFMQMIHDAIGEKPGTLALWEVPDAGRVLQEGAFWDIYYEHCSYFSPGSLARLFRQTGFEPIELELDFDDQYILLVGKVANGQPAPETPLALEDDLAAMKQAVEKFSATCPAAIEKWQTTITQVTDAGKKVAIWGSGSKCVAFLTTLGIDEQVGCIVDISPYRHGKFMPGTGHRIENPEVLTGFRPDMVIMMNPIYRQEISADLTKMGLGPELLAV